MEELFKLSDRVHMAGQILLPLDLPIELFMILLERCLTLARTPPADRTLHYKHNRRHCTRLPQRGASCRSPYTTTLEPVPFIPGHPIYRRAWNRADPFAKLTSKS